MRLFEGTHNVGRGDEVTTHAVGMLADTKQVFWTTRRDDGEKKGQPHEFVAGRGSVIKG